jgi:hypothetical protein
VQGTCGDFSYGRGDAVGVATIVVIEVAIVTLVDLGLEVAVATDRGHATSRALVAVVHVAVVALFDAFLDEAVTTSGALTRGRTFVGVDVVGVVTGLDTILDESVTAGRHLAGRGTVIGVDVVGVVAGLDARLNETVSAARLFAGREAGVGVILVAVVADFALLDDAVATFRIAAGLVSGVVASAVREGRRRTTDTRVVIATGAGEKRRTKAEGRKAKQASHGQMMTRNTEGAINPSLAHYEERPEIARSAPNL